MRQPKKLDSTTIVIYAIIAIALLYMCMVLGACFQLNTDDNGKTDFMTAINQMETTISDYGAVFNCL